MEVVSPSQPLRPPFLHQKIPVLPLLVPHRSPLPVISKVHFRSTVTGCDVMQMRIGANVPENATSKTHSILLFHKAEMTQ